MEKNYLARTLKGNPVINIQTGEKIATLDDLLIAPINLAVQALVTSKGNILNRKIEAIPKEHAQVWGKDAILVDGSSLVRRQEDLAGFEDWVTFFDDLKGRTVVSVDGLRVGQVGDLQVFADGKLDSIELSDVHVDGPIAEKKEIPMKFVRSLGPDVIIVDSAAIEFSQPEGDQLEEIEYEPVPNEERR